MVPYSWHHGNTFKQYNNYAEKVLILLDTNMEEMAQDFLTMNKTSYYLQWKLKSVEKNLS
jgi:hypothetical protein